MKPINAVILVTYWYDIISILEAQPCSEEPCLAASNCSVVSNRHFGDQCLKAPMAFIGAVNVW